MTTFEHGGEKMEVLETKELLDNNADQISEALGSDNRWFFGEHHPEIKNPTKDQLIEYYIRNGGALGHRNRIEEKARKAKNK